VGRGLQFLLARHVERADVSRATPLETLPNRKKSAPLIRTGMRDPAFKLFGRKLEFTTDHFKLAWQIICIVQVVGCVPRGCMVERRNCRSTGPAQAFAIAARARRGGGRSAYSRTCEGV
jgi:hypothetical protein